MIAVCIPSRGLMHSRTMQDILANTLGKDELGFYFSHGFPIPDSHNIPVEEALADKPDYIFLVEDDMALPSDILERMLEADVDLCVADYPVNGLPCIKYAKDGELLYAGVGCVLVKPWIFKKLGKPYFRTDTSYMADTMEPVPNKDPNAHGLLDVDFWVRALKLNPSYVVIGSVGHYNLVSPQLPKRGNQTGLEYKVEKLEL